MKSIVENVEFDTIAREWRCKWSADNDKASLVSLQKELETVLSQVKDLTGFQSVQRVVCGGCLDFKVIVAVSASDFESWEKDSFAPEADFLGKIGAIDGVSQVETQTYTLMTL
jgi:hypothetical protein